MKQVEDAIRKYLSSRKVFFETDDRHPDLLTGNDNIVGRIGEYLAIKYLVRQGRKPIKAASKSQKGHDLVEGKARISVKILTSENVRGRGLKLTEPWTEFILINLDTISLAYQLGHITKRQFKIALKDNPSWSATPFAKRTMLGPKGLIGRYGEVHNFRL